jgi:tetratricopeptide (TPR) repeat protein
LLLTSQASAATPEEEATEHHARGTKAFNLASYDEAIAEYEAAYRLKEDPNLLYNIAQAHRLALHFEKALRFYLNYLRLVPDTPLKGAVDERIAEINKLLASPPTNDAIPLAPPPVPAVVPTPSPNRTLIFTGVGLAAAGVIVALGGGVGFGLASSAKSDAIVEQARNHQPFDPTLEASKSLFNTLSIVSYVAGGVLALTGGVLLGLGLRHKTVPEKREVLHLMPGLSPAGAGLAVSVAF